MKTRRIESTRDPQLSGECGFGFRVLVRLTLALFLFLCPNSPARSETRSNILFVFADDWGRYASIFKEVEGSGSMNDLLNTPNIDRVAREGVLFRRAFVNAPSCTPCRSALLTGQYFWRTGRGAILSGAVWDPKIPSFPLMLHDAGYHIGQTWKVWSPGTPNDAPFGGEKFAYEKAGGRFNNFSENVTAMIAKGQKVDAAKDELLRDVDANFAAFLADRKSGQPFCYWFGPTNVHRQWVRGSGKALWGLDPDSLKGKLPKFLPDVPEVREDIADYFGEVQALDAAVGRLLKKLEAIGELDQTLVVISGDHGPPGFTHGKCNLYDFGTRVTLAIRGAGTRGGRVVDDFVCLPDLAPTFLDIGGVKPPEAMTGRSLVPVLRSEKSGHVDPQRSFVLTGRERHVDDARDGYLPYPQRAIRTNDFSYIINFEPDRWPMGNPYNLDGTAEPPAAQIAAETRVTLKDMDAGPTKSWLVAHRRDPQWQKYFDLAFAKRPREQLFDLKNDPDQTLNVAADPKYADIRAQLEQQLLDELTRTGDPRVTGDRKFFETPPLAGPIAGGQQKNAGQQKKKKTAANGAATQSPAAAATKVSTTRFIAADPKSGSSAAVVSQGAIAQTAQFLPVDADGNLMGADSEQQADAVLRQVSAALELGGSHVRRVVKINVYVTQPDATDAVRRMLARQFDDEWKPAVSFVQTRLPRADVSVAMDAIGLADVAADHVSGRKTDAKLSGNSKLAHVASLGSVPRIYIAGQAEKGANLREATTKTLEGLKRTLDHLQVDLKDVVQAKCFLTPMTEVQDVEEAIAKFFAGSGAAPACAFVEWESSLPIEIELLVADSTATRDPQVRATREPLEFITPPGMTASPVFCRVVRVNDPRTIFVSGLFSRHPADGTGQVTDVFAQLQDTLKAAGSDLRHLAKATYYVSDNEASAKLNELRPKFYDPARPPSASKAQVKGVGLRERSLTLDMIAVPISR